MTDKKIINKVSDFVKSKQMKESTGHDWWHTERVLKMAIYLARKEKADKFIVSLAALLHDIADYKFNDGNDNAGSKLTRELLNQLQINEVTINQVCDIVDNVSFKGEAEKNKMMTLEGKIVQDADRLDTLGAIGIARTFAYGGNIGREIYNPHIKPERDMDFNSYKKSKTHSINHFYEKLLLIRENLNSDTAKEIAEKRHQFMINFLDEFYEEWDVKI